MAFFNCPHGVLGPSDLDHAAALGYREEPEFEACLSCGARPDEDCAKGCDCDSCIKTAEVPKVPRRCQQCKADGPLTEVEDSDPSVGYYDRMWVCGRCIEASGFNLREPA